MGLRGHVDLICGSNEWDLQAKVCGLHVLIVLGCLMMCGLHVFVIVINDNGQQW